MLETRHEAVTSLSLIIAVCGTELYRSRYMLCEVRYSIRRFQISAFSLLTLCLHRTALQHGDAVL